MSFSTETVVHDSPDDPYAIKVRVERPSLTIYQPAEGRRNHVAVIVCPGGGYGRLYLTRGGIDYALFLSAHGYTAALLKYRLPRPDETTGNADPLPLQDAEQAMRVLRRRSSEYDLNPHWIGMSGTSAGGHVAACCAAFGDAETRPDFLILSSAVISLEPDIGHKGSRLNLLGPHPRPEDIERYSIERQVNATWPPTLVVVARNDPIPAENSFRLTAAIRAAGRSVLPLTYNEGGHAFALFQLKPPLTEWPDRWLHWMADLTYGR